MSLLKLQLDCQFLKTPGVLAFQCTECLIRTVGTDSQQMIEQVKAATAQVGVIFCLVMSTHDQFA